MTGRQRYVAGCVVWGFILYGFLTVMALSSWISERELWRRAVIEAGSKARPALNYGVALAKDGDREGAILHLVRAAELSRTERRGGEIRALVQHELRFMSAFGEPICSRPDVQPHC